MEIFFISRRLIQKFAYTVDSKNPKILYYPTTPALRPPVVVPKT